MADFAVVAPQGGPLVDSSVPSDALGFGQAQVARMVWALPLLGSGLSRRYGSLAPGESSLFGMDFSFLLPPRAVIVSATLTVFQNVFAPASPSSDIEAGAVTVEGSAVYARLTGGIEGTDYQIQWVVHDSEGNVWPRTALVLCARTS